MKLPPNAREQSDGSIIFPMRGDPPECDNEEYMQDPNDAYRWIRIYKPCKYRKKKEFKCQSGKIKIRDFCPLLGLVINPVYCNDICTQREE